MRLFNTSVVAASFAVISSVAACSYATDVTIETAPPTIVVVPSASASPPIAVTPNQCSVDSDCSSGERCNEKNLCVVPCHRDGDCNDPALWCGEPSIKGDSAFGTCQPKPVGTTPVVEPTPPPVEVPFQVITYLDEMRLVYPGNANVSHIHVHFQAGSSDAHVGQFSVLIIAPAYDVTDSTPFCGASCAFESDFNFQSFSLMDEVDGSAVLAGVWKGHVTSDQQQVVQFTFPEALVIPAGTTRDFVVVSSVADPLPAPSYGAGFQAIFLGVDIAASYINLGVPYAAGSPMSQGMILYWNTK